MSDPDGPIVRDQQESDRDQVLDILTESFAGFPPMDIITGTDSGSRERRRKVFELEIQPASQHHVVVAGTSAEVTGALIYADAPHCKIPSTAEWTGLFMQRPTVPGRGQGATSE
jgi:hypothetical protein